MRNLRFFSCFIHRSNSFQLTAIHTRTHTHRIDLVHLCSSLVDCHYCHFVMQFNVGEKREKEISLKCVCCCYLCYLCYTFVVTISSNFRQISRTHIASVYRCVICVCGTLVKTEKTSFFISLCLILSVSLLLPCANAASLSPLYLNANVSVSVSGVCMCY